MTNDRRAFFKKVAGAAVTVAGVEAVRNAAGTTPSALAAGVQAARVAVAGRYALELEGAMAGFLQSTEGGHATAEVVEESATESCTTRKHLANVAYEQVEISCGIGLSAAFYAWLQGVPGCRPLRQSGAILSADFNFKEVARLDFTNALITEFGLPALDAQSKDPALMTVTFSPESTQRKKGSGDTLTPCAPAKAQTKWLASNFRLAIDGLDCSKVTKVDAFTIKQQVIEGEPGRLEIPNLSVTLAESAAESFFDWHDDFVINGNNGSEAERNGTLEYLAPNLGQVLFTVSFAQLGIFKLAPEKAESGSDQVRRVKAEMYCEEMSFKFGATGC